MIWKIILTTMLHQHVSTGPTIAVSVVAIGQYSDAATCLRYAKFLAKGREIVYLDNTIILNKTAVCIPEEVVKK